MAVGIKLADNAEVYLGEIKEQLLSDLDANKIKYKVLFDKVNKNGIKETILHMKELDTEINIENDIITYIKAGNNQFTHLDKVEDIGNNTLSHVKKIQEQAEQRLHFNGYSIKIERIDTKTMSMTLIATSSTEKVRIQILRDGFGDVYINTLRAI